MFDLPADFISSALTNTNLFWRDIALLALLLVGVEILFHILDRILGRKIIYTKGSRNWEDCDEREDEEEEEV